MKIIKTGDGRIYAKKWGKLYEITGSYARKVLFPPRPVKPKEKAESHEQ